MHARSTTFHGQPDKVGAAGRFIETEVWPLLERIEGCRGLSLLVDPETGLCIATTSWTSEAAMRASNEQLRPFRERGRELMGGSMEVDDWQVAVMRRSQHGECCRVTWLEGDVAGLTELFRESVLPELEGNLGFCCASLLVNPDSGLACSTTAWESRAAMVDSQGTGEELRALAVREVAARVVQVHEFHLAYAHLHLPEMV